MVKEDHEKWQKHINEMMKKAKDAAGENWPADLDSDLTKFTDYFDSLGPQFAEINKESATRKATNKEKDLKIQQLSQDGDEKDAKIGTLSDDLEKEQKLRSDEQESLKGFNEIRRNEFKAKAEYLKLADNEMVQEDFIKLDKLDELTPDEVNQNMISLARLERLKVLDKVTVPQGNNDANKDNQNNQNQNQKEEATKLPYNKK